MGTMEDRLNGIMASMGELGKNDPETMKHFGAFMASSVKDGALDTKTKELMSLGMSMVSRCKYCISLHVKNAVDAGATKEEILETCVLAVLMGGGPAMAQTVEVIDSMRQCGIDV